MTRGWRIRMRNRFGYLPSVAWYEAVVDRYVTQGCKWLEVGGGNSPCPGNAPLAGKLAARCSLLVCVDPSPAVQENEFAQRRFQGRLEDFRSDEAFDLATLRMVAEHIERPTDVVESLSSLIRPGGHVLVFTPNRWSPGSLAARLLPQRWHAPVARWLWDTRAEDVFPTFYRMNTRRRLRALFEAGGFQEVRFVYLDNCSVLQRFRATCYLELCLWRVFRAVKVPYPENDLLGIYVKLG